MPIVITMTRTFTIYENFGRQHTGNALQPKPHVVHLEDASDDRRLGRIDDASDVRPQGTTVPVYAVGGVGAGNMSEWRKAGAAGFGLGSDLFKPDFSDSDIAARARRCVEAFRNAI